MGSLVTIQNTIALQAKEANSTAAPSLPHPLLTQREVHLQCSDACCLQRCRRHRLLTWSPGNGEYSSEVVNNKFGLQARLKERAKQTKEIVIEQLQAEEAATQAMREGPKEMGDIDTDDEQYAESEYVQWKNREYGRIRSILLPCSPSPPSPSLPPGSPFPFPPCCPIQRPPLDS